MLKGCAFLIFGFFLIILIPVTIGIIGGAFGLVVGLLGGIFGIIMGIIGAIFGGIAWIFKGIFHLLFGWTHFGFHCNGFILTALIIAIIIVAFNRRK
ncbi:MAG: hypothetical protein QM734_01020 [Cyclobacteriaceae bacterium]